MPWTIKQKINTAVLLAFLFLLCVVLLSYFSLRSVSRTNQWVLNIESALADSESLLSEIKDVDINAQYFLITGNEAALQAYKDRVHDVDALTRVLRDKLSDRPRQSQRLADIERLFLDRVSELDRQVLARPAQGTARANVLTKNTADSRDFITEMRLRISAMVAEERNLLGRRLDETRDKAGFALLILGIGLLFNFILLGLTYYFIQHELRERDQFTGTLQRQSEEIHEAQTIGKIGTWSVELPSNKLIWSEETYVLHGLPIDTPINVDTAIAHYLPEYRSVVREAFENGIRDGKAYDLEVQLRAADGRLIWVRAIGKASFDEQGKPIRMHGTLQDISERKDQEDELKAAFSLLETTNASLEKSMTQARSLAKAAQEATRIKSEFLANMSHELRTPMNVIVGMNELILRSHLNSEVRHYAEAIKQGSDHLLGLINDVLDFSKIESGRLELEERPLNLRSSIENVIDAASAKVGEKDIELLYSIAPGTPLSLRGDTTRFGQILANLVGNAVKFTMRGEVVVSVRSRSDETTPGKVHLQVLVKDTGIGIPAERWETLFEPFTQVDASMRRRFGGTGLGLAISRQLVELMGGEISVESELGKGSTFRFSVPMTESTDILPDYETHRDLLAGRRVVLIQDKGTARRLLANTVEFWGATVNEAETMAEAQALASSNRAFEVAVIDSRLLSANESEAKAAIMGLRIKNQSIILIIKRGERAAPTGGEFAVITKPVKVESLYARLKAALGLNGRIPLADQQSVEVKKRPAGKQGPVRILVAEDNLLNQQVIGQILERLGYQTALAANGREVLNELDRGSFDLILMDLQMPEVDGLQATREICRRWPKEQRPSIVALTANATERDREDCFKAGMDDFLAKPVRIQDLHDTIIRHTQKRT
ncbi:MAG TPA: response regulator [Opitutaceae bacterium]|nr:response regulator [Opitutaceae bacterium]